MVMHQYGWHTVKTLMDKTLVNWSAITIFALLFTVRYYPISSCSFEDHLLSELVLHTCYHGLESIDKTAKIKSL